jgi:NitT/TauT family transport system ATP-binding protein
VLLSSRIISLGRAGTGIAQDVTIDLPRPRDQIATRAEPRFTELRQQLFASIFMQEKTGASPPALSASPGEAS